MLIKLKMNVHSGTCPFLDRLPLFDTRGRSTVNLLAVSIDVVKETVYIWFLLVSF